MQVSESEARVPMPESQANRFSTAGLTWITSGLSCQYVQSAGIAATLLFSATPYGASVQTLGSASGGGVGKQHSIIGGPCAVPPPLSDATVRKTCS